MGIPGFYRWLTTRYPNTLCSVVEDHSRFLNGIPSPDTTQPNPNGVEFDNLYIHLNGAIHTCFHPQGMPAPQSYDEIFNLIFMYIDRVFSVVRPRKLLYIAVDGVAPRAKMNHQRIRCFKAAREAAGKGIRKREGEGKLDSNVITPGTEFMDLLSRALKYFVYLRVNTDPGWRGIKVILSDSTVVGEGEDKIMSYIRSQRNLPGYDSNTRHCLHGLDADLIMLALATHEIHISILMEVITNEREYRDTELPYSQCMREFMIDLEFEFFNIWVLREYLEMELLPNVEGTDFDRLIDDFVFMCSFVGNDYLPRLPSLCVSKGGIELLLMVYQQEFVKMGYLTNAPEVNLKSMEHFLQALSSHEKNIFVKRSQLNMEKNKRKRKDFQDSNDQLKVVEPAIVSAPNPDPNDGDVEPTTEKDKIHDSYMEQHYTRNFDCKSDDVDRIKRHAVLKYTEGICWIMHSIYQQVPSWQWFYPYHYAPLASDFCGLDKLEISFTIGQPFKPLDQLLGVLPAASAQALPLFYRELMTNKSSAIFDFYYKGATSRHLKMHDSWGVCNLPFIDESRLLYETAKVEHTLTDEEKQRNRFGRDMLFVHSSHPLAEMIKDLPSSDPSSEEQIQIRPDLSDGMNGYLCISDEPVFPSNIPSSFIDKPAVEMNCVKSVDYKCPSHAHIPKLLCGVIMPPRILRHKDRPRSRFAWHATPTQSVFQSECPTKKRKQDDKSCILGDATKADCVDLAVAPQPGGSRDEDKQQNVIIGKSEAELVVEGSQNHLISGKSTNQTQAHQQIKAGNGGMSDGTQRDDKQETGKEDEKMINTGTCEKPSKRKRQNKNKKQLETQQEVDIVDTGPEFKEHEAKSEVSQGIKIKVNSVKEPTVCEKPFTAAEAEAKGEVVDGIKSTVNSSEPTIYEKPFTGEDREHESLVGEPKMESPAAAEAVTNVEVGGESLTNKIDSVGGEPTDFVVEQVKDENMKANKRKKVKSGEQEATENEDDGVKRGCVKDNPRKRPLSPSNLIYCLLRS